MSWQSLGEHIHDRRVELRLTLDALGQKAGITGRVVSDLEHARRSNYDQSTLARMEQALGWCPGSVGEVLSGGQPAVATEPIGPIHPIAKDVARMLADNSPIPASDRVILATILDRVVEPYRSRLHDS